MIAHNHDEDGKLHLPDCQACYEFNKIYYDKKKDSRLHGTPVLSNYSRRVFRLIENDDNFSLHMRLTKNHLIILGACILFWGSIAWVSC